MMAKQTKFWIELTPTEANALMVMLDSEMDNRFYYGKVDLDNWENLDLEGYKFLAFHKFKTWYMENFDG